MHIPEIKKHLSITQTAAHLGIAIDSKTKRAHCPFHEDKTPSLQFSEEKQVCTCFSPNCHAGTMDIIQLTEKKLNLTTHQALNYLTTLAGGAEPKNNTHGSAPLPSTHLQTILSDTFQAFEQTFLASKPAKDYASSRTLDIKKLSIGYNSGTFHHGLQTNSQQLQDWQHLGLLKKTGSGYSVFGLASLCFALKNKQNKVTGLYFRAIEPRPAKFAKYAYEKHLYLKNRQGLYPSYPKPSTQKLILTESIIDAATLLSIPAIAKDFEILALYGTNGLTAEHTAAVSQLQNLQEIILFLDGDQGGKEASQKHAAYLKELLPNIQITITETPEDTDINELAQAHQSTIFTQLLKNRKPFFLSGESEGIAPPKSPKSETNTNPSKPTDQQPTLPKVSKLENKNQQSEINNLPSEIHNLLDTKNPNRLVYITPTANYTINGGIRKELDSLKVTLVIEHLESKAKARNKLDLYEDKQTEKIAREASEKLGLRADLVEFDLNHLTDLLDQYRESLNQEQTTQTQEITIPQQEKERCITFLKQPHLLKKINELIGKSGVIGEENNRLFLFGIASSYKMYDTLHALIQGSSGSGKTHLLSTIMDFMPPEDTISLTRVTESSFYNYGKYDLQNKLIGMEDFDGLEEKAELAFRELQSKGMISSSTSGKNELTGEIKGFIKEVYGPIASLSATTNGVIYEDNMSRCFLVAVDESHEQTRRIIAYQNKKAAGKIDESKEKEIRDFLRNCVRLLQPYKVINPFADRLNLPPEAHKIRRLNDLFQSYVKQITLLNQYQRRRTPTGALITEKEDIQTAVEIMFESIVLKVDELDGSLRMFYEKLKDYVLKKSKEYEFSRIEIRQEMKLSNTQLHRYLKQLLELEYIYQSSGHDNRGHKYKIQYWDNLQALRNRIKKGLNDQLEKL